MSDDNPNRASNEELVLERISYLEKAIGNYGAQLRSLNDTVGQLQISNNSLVEQANNNNHRIEDILNTVNELVQRAKGSENPERDTVDYQKERDEDRHAALLKTDFTASTETIDEIFAKVNSDVFHQMQCAKGLKSGSIADSLAEYKRILSQIVVENPELKFVTAHALSQLNLNGEKSYCQIRHDVDADIVACLPICLLYTSPSPRDQRGSRMPSSA